MPRRRTHTEKWWAAAGPETLRCTAHYKSTGDQCRSEAWPGTNVCDKHGALIPAVQAKAATRIQMSVDEASKFLLDGLADPQVDMRERIKIAHDLLDRGGLAATQKHLIGVVTQDPVEALFASILSDPNALADPSALPPAPDPEQAAIDARAEGDLDYVFAPENGRENRLDIVDAEVVEEPAPRKAAEPVSGNSRPPKHIYDDLQELGLL